MASNPKVRASSSAQGILGLGGGVLGRVPIRGKGASVSSFFSKWHAGFRRYLHPAGVNFIAPSEVWSKHAKIAGAVAVGRWDERDESADNFFGFHDEVSGTPGMRGTPFELKADVAVFKARELLDGERSAFAITAEAQKPLTVLGLNGATGM